MKHENNAIIGL